MTIKLDCAGIIENKKYADMPHACCEKEVSHALLFQDLVDSAEKIPVTGPVKLSL